MVNSHLTVMDPDARQGLIARSAVRKKNVKRQRREELILWKPRVETGH